MYKTNLISDYVFYAAPLSFCDCSTFFFINSFFLKKAQKLSGSIIFIISDNRFFIISLCF